MFSTKMPSPTDLEMTSRGKCQLRPVRPSMRQSGQGRGPSRYRHDFSEFSRLGSHIGTALAGSQIVFEPMCSLPAESLCAVFQPNPYH